MIKTSNKEKYIFRVFTKYFIQAISYIYMEGMSRELLRCKAKTPQMPPGGWLQNR